MQGALVTAPGRTRRPGRKLDSPCDVKGYGRRVIPTLTSGDEVPMNAPTRRARLPSEGLRMASEGSGGAA
jgi:hypothetical protein